MDEHVSGAVIHGLRIRGIDVLSTKNANMMGAPDEEHLEFAEKEKRVIFTQDTDFLKLHAAKQNHHGIVYAHQRTPIGDVVRGLILIYEVLNVADMINHVEFL